MSILNHWPFPTFRAGQKEVLEKIERAWDKYSVIVLILPTGYGKTPTSYTLSAWRHALGEGSTTVVPNNVLLSQSKRAFPRYHTVGSVKSYRSRAGYLADKSAVSGSMALSNYYGYLGNKMYNPTLIVDEASMIVDFLRDKEGITLWQHLEGFPDSLYTMGDLVDWLESLPNPKAKHKKLLNKLSGPEADYVLEMGRELWRGKSRVCLKLKPLSPRNASFPIMWPSSVKKVVLMSATFNEEDLHDLGLDKRRYTIIEAPSPIPAERRPVRYVPVANVSYKNYGTAIPEVVGAIEELLEKHPEKGIIHAPYGLASKLKKHLHTSRVWTHTRFNKKEVVRKWLQLPPESGIVLLGSGLTEGLSLDDDLARWQVIAKVPYANLRDRVIRARLEQRPRAYQWMAARDMMQAAGRVCRGPEDYGVTYILDENFGRLYKQHNDLFYNWFKEAIV